MSPVPLFEILNGGIAEVMIFDVERYLPTIFSFKVIYVVEEDYCEVFVVNHKLRAAASTVGFAYEWKRELTVVLVFELWSVEHRVDCVPQKSLIRTRKNFMHLVRILEFTSSNPPLKISGTYWIVPFLLAHNCFTSFNFPWRFETSKLIPLQVSIFNNVSILSHFT